MVVRTALTGDVNGEYVVDEILADGRLVVRPDTSAEAIYRRQRSRPVTAEEFEQHFGDLPTDDEPRAPVAGATVRVDDRQGEAARAG